MSVNNQRGSTAVDEAGDLMKRGQIAEAQALLSNHLEVHPNDAKASYLWGISQLRQGKAVAAETVFKRILGQWPENYGAAFSLGLALEQQGKADEAIEAYHTATLLKPDFGPARAKLISHGHRPQGALGSENVKRQNPTRNRENNLPKMTELSLPASDEECAQYKKYYAAKIRAQYEANRDLIVYLLDHEVPELVQKISDTEAKRLFAKGGNDVVIGGVTNLLRLLRG